MAADAYDRFRAWARATLHHRTGTNEIYQTSTMGALLDGLYDGDVTIAELLSHGDFGLGTFNRLDGEMVILDGRCHHLRADGSARIAAPDDRTPFAAVTWFRPSTTLRVDAPIKRADLLTRIDQALPTTNMTAAVRIHGHFRSVETRTVMAQKQPYPPLTKATAGQAVTTFDERDGDLAGFRTPEYEQGISVAGYHLHFLTDDHQHGGHSLDFELTDGEVRVCTESQLHLSLPRTPEFARANLSGADIGKQIRQSEGG
ncbi:acetolactate decarboxylase [Asanoa hainanensis]|uniref:Alpha-acetolactate decarboxylase n=1 Tax=Asanoa hainanensis TaxID=560556 RepID=A0A239JY18_9ACTN|nr:acetolactate decarboxylase [Asanoa hainanensis]SNT10378.1 acetolactate decarboxylase [Asanoa hainanensis]